MKNLLYIFTYIFTIYFIILIVRNKEKVNKAMRKIAEKRFIIIIINIIISAVLIVVSFKSIDKMIKAIDNYKEAIIFKEECDYYDEKIREEDKYYREMIQNASEISAEPYIPDNFKYICGNIESGYVIQDEFGNEFVWIPCSKRTLKKENFDIKGNISYNYCYDENYKNFIESSLKYGGFYISRFEIGKENGKPVSKYNTEVWDNINKQEAINIISQFYENQNINIELINGYAYDTTLRWIMNSGCFETNKIDIKTENGIIAYDINFNWIDDIEKNKIKNESEKITLTGRNKINNIYDFTDNIYELTQERVYDVVIARGYLKDNKTEMFSRFTILEDDRNFIEGKSKLAMRAILYK